MPFFFIDVILIMFYSWSCGCMDQSLLLSILGAASDNIQPIQMLR